METLPDICREVLPYLDQTLSVRPECLVEAACAMGIAYRDYDNNVVLMGVYRTMDFGEIRRIINKKIQNLMNTIQQQPEPTASTLSEVLKTVQPASIINLGTYIAEQRFEAGSNTFFGDAARPRPEQSPVAPPQVPCPSTAPPKPAEGDYVGLVAWLDWEKSTGHDWYTIAGKNSAGMCRLLNGILGWIPDDHSLRRAKNRQ